MTRLTLTYLISCLLAQSAELRFVWSANTEPDLAGYYLHHGPESRAYTNRITLALGTNCTVWISGRQFFALSAFNTAGLESEMSEELVYEPLWLISERSADGVIWTPAMTNELAPLWPVELWRLRIEHNPL